MYRPLGTGDIDVPAIVGHLRACGYDGWYTLEQDTILTEEPMHHGRSKTSRPAPNISGGCCVVPDDVAEA